MVHIPLKFNRHIEFISTTQLVNLIKLANLLETKAEPNHFNMKSYFRTSSTGTENFTISPHASDTEVYNTCGTTACAVGHGPILGFEPEEDEDWDHYSERVFGVAPSGVNVYIWNFLFGPYWMRSPENNTPVGTAKRIKSFIANGLPQNLIKILENGDTLSIPLGYYTDEKKHFWLRDEEEKIEKELLPYQIAVREERDELAKKIEDIEYFLNNNGNTVEYKEYDLMMMQKNAMNSYLSMLNSRINLWI